MRGQKTAASLEAKFRAEYLRLANASRAGQLVGIEERTARNLAQKADADPEFSEARRQLYARALDETESLMLNVVRTAHDRYQDELPEPEIPEGFRGTIIVKDERPAHGRLVVDSHRALLAHQKAIAEAGDGPSQPVVVIDRYAPPGAHGSGSTGSGDSPESTELPAGGIPTGGGTE